MGRAPSINSALQKINKHVGTASSVLVFSNFFIASIAMLIASIEVNNQIALIAIITVCACAVNAALMFGLRRSGISSSYAIHLVEKPDTR